MLDGLGFLQGGGQATRLLLDRDWSAHPLGPPAGWPEGLKAALSLVLNSPESMILAWGREELSFFFNEAYFPLLGPRLPTAMGAPFQEVWADAWVQARPIIDDAFAGRSQRFNDLPWTLGADRGPAETWWTFSYSRVLDAEGEVVGLFIFTNETTARVVADAALRESEERLRLVVQGAIDHAILTTDPAGVITSWSTGAEKAFGWSAEEAVGRPAALIFTPEDRELGVDERELLTAKADGCANDERWHLTKSGARVFMNGSVHRLPPDATGAERGFIKIARDETERWRTRKALETLNATLEQQVAERTAERDRMWANSRDLQVIIGPDGVFRAVSPAWTFILGHDPSEVVGRSYREFLLPEDETSTVGALDDATKGRDLTDFENRYVRKDGSVRRIAWRTSSEGELAYGYGRDVTTEWEKAEALRTAEDQLRQAQKMEAVGQLTGGLAHDFNNLLAGISGSLELMRTRIGQGRLHDVERYLVAAQGAAERAASLTHRLLAFSRRQTLDPRPTDVNRLAAGMEELIRRTVGPTVAIEVRPAQGLWPVMVDPPQLENALLNLCINARDAMAEGGRIVVETANVSFDAAAARQQNAPEGDHVAVCVTDTGTGMPPEVVARVFEPFFTTKPIGEGTGLGLSMIYGFAQQSGGQVRIESEVGAGTSVCIYLPRHHGAVEEESGPRAFAPVEPSDEGETVLVVDDEPTVRMLITDILGDLGYSAVEASDGIAGLRVLQSSVRIDLLITDVGLPGGVNGRQMADAARASRPELKVLFITGYAESAALGGGRLDPGMAVLTKPFAIDAMASRIKQMIEAGRGERGRGV